MRGAQLGDRKIVFPAGPLGQVGSRTAQDPALMLEQPIALLQLTQFGRLLGRDTGPDAGEGCWFAGIDWGGSFHQFVRAARGERGGGTAVGRPRRRRVDAAGVEGRRVRRAGPVIRWQVGHGSRIDLVAR
jgi:hypothetical protein